ncbi:MAG: hypothetical protein ACR2KC_06940 [Acidimicrobiales bacterium]
MTIALVPGLGDAAFLQTSGGALPILQFKRRGQYFSLAVSTGGVGIKANATKDQASERQLAPLVVARV